VAAIERLKSVWDMERHIKYLSRLIEECQDIAESITTTISDMPKVPTHGSKIERCACTIADIRDNLLEQKIRLLHEKQEILSAIEEIEDHKTKSILVERYFLHTCYNDLCRKLEISSTTASRKHAEGLAYLEKYFADIDKNGTV